MGTTASMRWYVGFYDGRAFYHGMALGIVERLNFSKLTSQMFRNLVLKPSLLRTCSDLRIVDALWNEYFSFVYFPR